MFSLVAENDERPSSSHTAQPDCSVAEVESHNPSSEEPLAKIFTQADAQPDTQHRANDPASTSEATQTPANEQNTGRQPVKPGRCSHPGSFVISLGLLILLLADFTVPLSVTITYGLRAYQTYTER
jgi:hypothetical protein